MNLKNIGAGGCGLDSSGSRYRKMVASSKLGNESSGSIKSWKFPN
jgi:hypothetical protein